MDQATNDIRRANWLNTIKQCQERPAEITAKQWLIDNGIHEKVYYYWLRKFRNEAYGQMQMPAPVKGRDIAFAEICIPENTSRAVADTGDTAVVIRRNGLTIEVSNSISETLFARLLQEVTHA